MVVGLKQISLRNPKQTHGNIRLKNLWLANSLFHQFPHSVTSQTQALNIGRGKRTRFPTTKTISRCSYCPFLQPFIKNNIGMTFFFFFHVMCVLRTCYPPGLSAGEKESRTSPNPCRSCRGKPGEKLRGGTVPGRWHKRLTLIQTSPKLSIHNDYSIYLYSSLESLIYKWIYCISTVIPKCILSAKSFKVTRTSSRLLYHVYANKQFLRMWLKP